MYVYLYSYLCCAQHKGHNIGIMMMMMTEMNRVNKTRINFILTISINLFDKLYSEVKWCIHIAMRHKTVLCLVSKEIYKSMLRKCTNIGTWFFKKTYIFVLLKNMIFRNIMCFLYDGWFMDIFAKQILWLFHIKPKTIIPGLHCCRE